MARSARAAVDDHMVAVNLHDAERLMETLHFPFVQLWPDGQVVFEATSEGAGSQYRGSVLGTEWHHSTVEQATELTKADEAVAFRVEFTRRREDDSVIARYEAVWVTTQRDDVWRIQFRHGPN